LGSVALFRRVMLGQGRYFSLCLRHTYADANILRTSSS